MYVWLVDWLVETGDGKMDFQEKDSSFVPLVRVLASMNLSEQERDRILGSYMFMYEDKGISAYKHSLSRKYVYVTEAGKVETGEIDISSLSPAAPGLLEKLIAYSEEVDASDFFARLSGLGPQSLFDVLLSLGAPDAPGTNLQKFAVEYSVLLELAGRDLLSGGRGSVNEAVLRKKYHL